MYEIWSVGHKPFEDYANNTVLNFIIVLAIIDSHLLLTGDEVSGYRLPFAPSSWLPPCYI